MSRRYGRKQRRAARDRIEVLEAAHDMACNVAAAAQQRSHRSEHKTELLLEGIRLWDSEIRSLLGPYTSFAIEEPTFRVDTPDQIRQMPVMPPRPICFLGVDSQIGIDSIYYHIETMLGFMCGLDEDILQSLRRFLTVRIKVGDDYPLGQEYYAVSEQTWHQMKRDGPNNAGLERFIHRIAGDLVRLLVTPPKKKPSGDDLVPAMERDAERLRR